MGETINQETLTASLQTHMTCQDHSNTRLLESFLHFAVLLQVKQTNKLN